MECPRGGTAAQMLLAAPGRSLLKPPQPFLGPGAWTIPNEHVPHLLLNLPAMETPRHHPVLPDKKIFLFSNQHLPSYNSGPCLFMQSPGDRKILPLQVNLLHT